MKLWDRYTERRRRKLREVYLRERDRQKLLNGQDAQEAIRGDVTSGAAKQSIFGGGS